MPQSQLLQLTVQHPAQLQHHPAARLHQGMGSALLLPLCPPADSAENDPTRLQPWQQGSWPQVFTLPLVAFSGPWSSSSKQRCNSLTQGERHLTLLPCKGKILRFTQYYLQIGTFHVVWVGCFPFSAELM